MSWFEDDPGPTDPPAEHQVDVDVLETPNTPDVELVPLDAYDEPPPAPTNGHRNNGRHQPTETRDRDLAPHDLRAERSLLGAGMLGVDITTTPPEAFYAPGHGHIAQAIAALADAGQEHDSVIVASWLADHGLLDQAGGYVQLATIMAECPATTAAPAYARIVQDHARARRLLHAAAELTTTVRTYGPDAGHQLLQDLLDTHTAAQPHSSRLVPGSWLLDVPANPDAIWGRDSEVLWAAGEPCLITGPPGVGKTTLTGQLVHARLGLSHEVLGWPVQPDPGKILYLASDRPQQIRRALARGFTTADRQHLDAHLTIWPGPPPADLAKDTSILTRLAREAGASTVVLDSLKDMAIGLSDDEVGAGLNQAMQLALQEGIDVLALHHQRKGTDGKRPKTLEDLYGSTWIAAGAGSILLLWGAAGDPIVEVHHLKQPSSDVGPLKIEHDHHTGTSTVHRGFDLHAALRNAPQGLTVADVARMWLEKDKPNDNERKKAWRRLENHVRLGLARRNPQPGRDPKTGGALPDRYFAIDTHHQEQF